MKTKQDTKKKQVMVMIASITNYFENKHKTRFTAAIGHKPPKIPSRVGNL